MIKTSSDVCCDGCSQFWDTFDKDELFPTGEKFKMFKKEKLCYDCYIRRKKGVPARPVLDRGTYKQIYENNVFSNIKQI
jgi:hypothetical protein